MAYLFLIGLKLPPNRFLKRSHIFSLLIILLVLATTVSIVSISQMHRSEGVTTGRKRPTSVFVQESDFMLRDNNTGRLVWDVKEMKRLHSIRRPANITKRPPSIGRGMPNRRSKQGGVGVPMSFDHSLKMADPNLPPLTRDWLTSREAVFEDRANRLLSVCREHDVRIGRGNVTNRPGSGPVERIYSDHFVSVPSLNVTFCLLAKVASTSLLSTLLHVTGHGVPVLGGNRTSQHGAIGSLRPAPAKLASMLRGSLTVLLVRHPLRRLVAAYRDKIATRTDWPLLRHYELLKFGGSAPASPRARQLRELELQQHRRDALRRRGVATFGEFLAVTLIGEHPLRDAHWTPYWRHCAPCHIGYRLIVQLETAADDLRYLWHALRLYFWVEIPWLHRSRPEQESEEGLQQLADTYLRPVDRPIMFAFKREYKLDFDLFGYDWATLMRMSGHCVIGDAECDLL